MKGFNRVTLYFNVLFNVFFFYTDQISPFAESEMYMFSPTINGIVS